MSPKRAARNRVGAPRTVARIALLASQWDTQRNGDLRPDALTLGSQQRVWWKCANGVDHVWRAAVAERTRGRGCPFCANRRVSVTNALAAVAPELALEWDAKANGALKPTAV